MKVHLTDAQTRTIAAIMYGGNECGVEDTNLERTVAVEVNDSKYLIGPDGLTTEMKGTNMEPLGNPGLQLRRPERTSI
jgi:hypothetical protein